MRLAVGPSLTGTAKCFSSLAAAEACAGTCERVLAGSAAGMTIGAWHAGQVIVLPAIFASASSCCLHDGHTNITSIAPPTSWVFDCPISSRRAGEWRAEKVATRRDWFKPKRPSRHSRKYRLAGNRAQHVDKSASRD